MRSMWRPILRQVRIKPGMSGDALETEVQSHLDAGRMVVLDHYDENTLGGAGKTFDWSVAEGVADRDGVLLAGGLTPDNVASAIQKLRPWGVDVSSGVETDGVKDRKKIRGFHRDRQGDRPGGLSRVPTPSLRRPSDATPP